MRKITSLLTTAMLAGLLVPGLATAQEGSQQATARVFHCGLVKAYTAPEGTRDGLLFHESDGSITVGEKTLAIAAGAQNHPDARPVVGKGTCLDGRLNASGALISYWGLGMPPTCLASDVARYEPATATSDGVIQFAAFSSPPYTADSHVFRIPAGTVLPDDVADPDRTYCFYVFNLDSEGRAILTRVEDHTPPERTPGQSPAGDHGRGSTGGPRQLPSTSTR
jgi:hypothetical protein